MGSIFQKLVRLNRIACKQGKRAALKAMGRHLGPHFDLAIVPRLEAALGLLQDENRSLRQQLASIERQQQQNSQSIRWLADHHGSAKTPVRRDAAVEMAATRVSVIMPTWNRAATICDAI